MDIYIRRINMVKVVRFRACNSFILAIASFFGMWIDMIESDSYMTYLISAYRYQGVDNQVTSV